MFRWLHVMHVDRYHLEKNVQICRGENQLQIAVSYLVDMMRVTIQSSYEPLQ